MRNDVNRRDVLRAAGAVAGAGLVFPAFARAANENNSADILGKHEDCDWIKPKRPVTAIIIGAGGRGNCYAGYAPAHKDEWKIVGVAEPIPYRNKKMAKTHGIPDQNRFVTWEHVFDKPKFADVCVITTPDDLHYGPAMAALEKGYDLLLEKVVAQKWSQCNDIRKLANKNGRTVAVCHVLRYTPYYRQMKHIINSGFIGDVVSLSHLEQVGHIHMSHSFVRGNWGNEKKSNPMLLSKSCHDLDILRWMIDKPCKRVSSFGSLKLFRKEMAPPGAPMKCTDGCPVEKECPFSAYKVYLEHKFCLHHLNTSDRSREGIVKALKEGPYGRCVYHCDNDVVDHQITNMEFADGVTASFSMEGLTSYSERRTRVMGTDGDIIGDSRFLDVFKFSTRKRVKWDVRKDAKITSGHGGGDYGLVRDFIQAVSRKDPTLLTSTIDASMESHLMGFVSEQSRHTGKTLDVKLSG